ncbi:hypothetical protein OAI47_00755 [Rhodospirillaceae bacterium]|nr:hypothetical protein [Rhodospirillaceae bacterium]
MATMDDVPSHWISKASIAKRRGISRVTVDKQLTKIENDPDFSGQLNVLIVDEGKRKLYFYDPSDVDAVFSGFQKKRRRRVYNVKRTDSRVSHNVTLSDNEIVKVELELQKEELKRIALEKEVARLEDHLNDLRSENIFLKAQLTDQRPKSSSTPELIKEVVIANKLEPETVFEATGRTKIYPEKDFAKSYAEIREAVANAEKSNDERTKYAEIEELGTRAGDNSKDAEPKEQPKLQSEEDTQSSVGAKYTETEERRARIDEDLKKPQCEQKTGFWNWLKGY